MAIDFKRRVPAEPVDCLAPVRRRFVGLGERDIASLKGKTSRGTLLCTASSDVIVFISITTKKAMGTDKVDLTDADASPAPRRSAGQIRSAWLSYYPIFRDALQACETNFRELPPYVKLPVLRRMGAAHLSARSASLTVFDGVRASYVELSTNCVVQAVESYLFTGRSSEERESTTLEAVAAGFPPTVVPLVARPPCFLSPGKSIFLDGWTRFFAYWSRNDKTIPLLAVDWLVLYERITVPLPPDEWG
jgi:hypothetical protein